MRNKSCERQVCHSTVMRGRNVSIEVKIDLRNQIPLTYGSDLDMEQGTWNRAQQSQCVLWNS